MTCPDYHDYFIKDGRHLGRYEEMYRDCPDPWHIEELGERLDMRAALLLLSGRAARVGRFLDIGAGLGLFSGMLARAIWAENPAAQGVISDVSATAVSKAARRLADPRLEFLALDAGRLAQASPFAPESFDLLVLAQVLWGLLENLTETLAALARLLPQGGLMLLSQHFPPADRQSYGADIVSSPADLGRRLEGAGFRILETIECNRAFNHHWAALAEKSS